MVSLIVGEKGKGKTKYLLDMANDAVNTADGNIVYIDKNSKHMYELNRKVRLIDASRFPLKSGDEFIGLLAGAETMDAVVAKAGKHRELFAYAYALADTDANFDTPRLPWVKPWRFMVDITDAGMGHKSRAAQEVVKATGASTVITVGDAPNDLGLIMAYQGYAVNPGFVLSGWVPEKRRLRAFTDLFAAAPELQVLTMSLS